MKIKSFKFRTSIYLLLISLLFIACGSKRMLVSDVSPQSISELVLMFPGSNINLIEKNNETVYNEKLSNIATQNVINGIYETFRNKAIVKEAKIEDYDYMDIIYKDVYEMLTSIELQRKKQNRQLPPSLHTYLQHNDIDYALIVFHDGFTRSSKNYRNQILLSILFSALTGGNYTMSPVKSNSMLRCCIADRINSNLAFYNYDFNVGVNPVDKRDTDKQLFRIFKKYLYKTD